MYKQLINATTLLILIVALYACSPFNTPQTTKNDQLKLAAIFPGVITDADYNTLGYIAITALNANLGVPTTYTENVDTADAENIIREHISNGYNIIFTHGGQFLDPTTKLAKEFPDVYFIGETDAVPENIPANLWVIERNFHTGFYPLGVVAGKQSKTGKIGYLGGLPLPFSYAEVHAIEQAIADNNLDVELKPVWVGDFNDPAKARKLTETMIAEDIDVIIGSLNLGMFGLFEAVKSSDKQVWATAKYTDKTDFGPGNYITSVIYDFTGPLQEIVQNIQNGKSGGLYPLGFDTGVEIQPLKNTSPELSNQVEQVIQDIQTGKTIIKKNTTAIE